MLTLSVTAIEVMSISAVMLHGDNNPTLVRDTLFAIETPSGYLLTPYDPAVEEQLSLGRKFTAEYRETFRALAK